MFTLKIFLVLCCLTIFTSGLRYSDPITSTYTANMNAAQVVDGSNSNAQGTARFFYDAKKETLSWQITHNVQNPLTADLHGPAEAGTNTKKAAVIAFPSATSPITGASKISDQNAINLINDLLYVQIHTANNPLGEIRGQVILATIEGVASGVADLQPENNVPPVTTSQASGMFRFEYSNLTNILTWSLSHNVPNATAAHIHGPATPAENAGVLFTFPSVERKSSGNMTLTVQMEEHLLNELLYVAIHSNANPNGEVRGQIEIKKVTLGLDDSSDSSGLSGGEVFAIVFFVFVGILVVVGGAYFVYVKKAKANSFHAAPTGSSSSSSSSFRKGGLGASLLDDAQPV